MRNRLPSKGINAGGGDLDNLPDKINVVEAENIIKDFSGVRVLHGVDFSLRRGEVHALLGENGAGKSTLMKILAGVYQKTGGVLRVNGQEVDFKSRHDADTCGIGIVFQEFSQVPQLSVVDNLFLGKELYKTYCGGKIKKLDHSLMKKKAEELLERFDISLPLDTPVKDLGVANQQLIEICKALFYHAGILIMDEPTAALSDTETEKLFAMIKALKEKNVSIIYISHRLEEIKKICDRATIIRDGRNVATIDVDRYSVEDIITFMVGRNIKDIYPEKNTHMGEVLLEVKNLFSPGKFKDLSFQVKSGEIIGITGLVGAGKTEVAQALFGLDKSVGGEIRVKGKELRVDSPQTARKYGFALIPEDRKRQGVILKHSLYENVCLPNFGKYRNRFGALNLQRCMEDVQESMAKVAVSPMEPGKKASLFSGGNQQKIVIAKWLNAEADIYIFDEPTRGVDIGAKAEIYKLIAELARAGCAIIICSSEIYEIMGMCNRIIVMKKGRIAGITDDMVSGSEVLLKAQLGNKDEKN